MNRQSDITVEHPAIPLDLIREIAEHIQTDIPSLYALSLASKAWRYGAQRLLFKNATTLCTLDEHFSFLAAVTASPTRLALYVKAYTQGNGPPGSNITTRHEKKRLDTLTAAALPTMKNLKRLSFLSQVGQLPPSASFLQRCQFSLESFEWEWPLSDSQWEPNTVKQIVKKFLPRHAPLKHLHLQWEHLRDLPVPPHTVCPQLVSLAGSRGIINAFLPGRKISTLKWIPAPHDSLDPMPHLAPEFNHIRHLVYGWEHQRPPLNILINHLKSLELLELVGDDIEEHKLLYQLPALRVLILTSDSGGFGRIHISVATDLMLNCAKLECIDIEIDDNQYVRHLPPTYDDFGQPVAMWKEVDLSEVHSWWAPRY